MKKLAIILCSLLIHYACYADQIGLHNKHIDIRWVRTSEGWKITRLTHTGNGEKCSWGTPDGSYTILFSAEKPDQETPETVLDRNKDTILFVEPHFKNVLRNLDRSLTEVPPEPSRNAICLLPHRSQAGREQHHFRGCVSRG